MKKSNTCGGETSEEKLVLSKNKKQVNNMLGKFT